MDWRELVKPEELSFILGNSPFLGKQHRNVEQNGDMDLVFDGKIDNFGILDYVTTWYIKASNVMEENKTKPAFCDFSHVPGSLEIGFFLCYFSS